MGMVRVPQLRDVVWESNDISWDFPLLMTSAFLPCGKKFLKKISALNILRNGCCELDKLDLPSCPREWFSGALSWTGRDGPARCR